MQPTAVVAAARFGLGARPGELEDIARDPRGWLDAQLGASAPKVAELQGLAGSDEITAVAMEARADGAEGNQARNLAQRGVYALEAAARCQAMVASEAPFRERLVAFYGNHLTVSTTRGVISGLVGAFEREAIRPFVCGRYEDMLLAATRHPAMLLYLDNARSTGPGSWFARGRGGRPGGPGRAVGLNENHARELLELHTLGVDGGYTQADVEAVARVLTGWSLGQADGGGYRFAPERPEPGDQVVLGQTYVEAGEEEGLELLRHLARHPSTARTLGRKLARHFSEGADTVALATRLERSFLDTEGDLAAVARTLVGAPEAWAAGPRRLRSPHDLVIAAGRAVAYEGDGRLLHRSMATLGQAPFSAPSPAGWPDDDAAWSGPEAVLARVEWAEAVGARTDVSDPSERARDVLGPWLSARTRDLVVGAGDRHRGLALLIASPEFQRR
jgi:uncharacterized protein (DUF1800 family)